MEFLIDEDKMGSNRHIQVVFEDEEERIEWLNENDVHLPPSIVGLLEDELDPE